MIATLEQQLEASLAMVNAGKLHIMPRPAPPPLPGSSEIPTVLSPSSVNTFLHDCSLKWYYRKVLKLPETRGSALGLGTSVHHALIENFRQKIDTKKDMTIPDTEALFIRALVREMDLMTLEPDESIVDLKEAGEAMVKVYMRQASASVQPAAVEEHVEGLIGDVPVHGYIDIRDVDGRIIDLKTAKKKPSGVMPSYRLQVATYSMLHPESNQVAQIATLTKTQRVALHQETIEVLPRDRQLTTSLYSIARDQMQSGLYAPNRGSMMCSRKYCSHWQRCEDEFGGQVAGAD